MLRKNKWKDDNRTRGMELYDYYFSDKEKNKSKDDNRTLGMELYDYYFSDKVRKRSTGRKSVPNWAYWGEVNYTALSTFSVEILSLFDFLCRENWRAQLMSLEGGAITYLEVQQQALHNTDNKEFVQWCAHRNLVEPLDPPPQCECGMPMRLQKSKCFKDGVCFRCHFCGKRQSVRGNTWMADSNMTLRSLALLLACWCAQKGIEETRNVTGASRATVMQRFREFRDYAEEKYRQDVSEHPLGGNDRICQVDESLFGKAKYHVGRQLATQQWAVGAYDQENSRVAVEFTPDRTSESLLGFIASTVQIGITIYTDQWRGYNGLPRIGYPHRTVNHSQEFVSDAGVHTQGIEGTWGVMKAWLRRRSATQRTTLEGHVHEWAFRRNLAQDFARCWDLMNQ